MRMNDTSILAHVLLQKIVVGCLLFSLAIFTVFGNLVVLYAIRTEKRLRTVANLFILSLAFADLVVGFIVMPLSAAHIIAGRWPFSNALCQMWLSIDYVASTASIFNLILLSLDRYWAVVHPLLYLQNRSRKRAIYFILIIWFISFLWVPAIIFWSFLIPEHSVILKPHECDTSFRANKLFKTLTALVNFYLPLLTMIFISCRIMVAIRSRSTMEFGRRISATTRKQMRHDRTLTNVSMTRHENESVEKDFPRCLSSVGIDEQPTPLPIVANPFESIMEHPNLLPESSIPIIDADENRRECQTRRKTPFRLSNIRPIRIFFPSLSSIKESNQRKSEDLTRGRSGQKAIKNSSSVSKNMKYADRQFNPNYVCRLLSTESSSSDDCSNTSFGNTIEQQTPTTSNNLSVHVITPVSSPSHLEDLPSTNNSNSSVQSSNSKKINILTFVDYIINPSRSGFLQKELKAARQLGMLVGVFTVTWLPYFVLFLVVAWCQQCVSETVYTASIWLGYLNSTFNPLIYPLCNKHFRRVFRKIFSCHHAKTKLPNVNGLREHHALHSIRYRR